MRSWVAASKSVDCEVSLTWNLVIDSIGSNAEICSACVQGEWVPREKKKKKEENNWQDYDRQRNRPNILRIARNRKKETEANQKWKTTNNSIISIVCYTDYYITYGVYCVYSMYAAYICCALLIWTNAIHTHTQCAMREIKCQFINKPTTTKNTVQMAMRCDCFDYCFAFAHNSQTRQLN